ncbi:DNA/RNA-binding protein KIN17-like [Teleopsis dalmanni]|uniref:DNA/RNA-binding protein KIN17-like n=1 Tax=Teleopsis dalmanni TaxID=139649 RepID=UPI0018CDA94B|nr:DNA/RNA-binding protein KIN17-like [Teleopsis dalmanni]
MGKAEKGTPKYLANKMKAKGLQKLRWYCQMCEKQCRDENGFKCHTMSESHQRQLLLFADSPGKFLYSFSKEFSDGYMELLRRRFGTKRVNANKVYQEYISAKDHIHMNATRWLTLSDYVKWLGRSGQVIADETEKGWYVSYIDRSPDALERQSKMERKEKMEKDDEERMLAFVEKQIEKAKCTTNQESTECIEKFTELKRDESQPLKLDIKVVKNVHMENTSHKVALNTKHFKMDTTIKNNTVQNVKQKSKSDSSTTSALDEIMLLEEQAKERSNRKDYWLHEGIVVKFISKSMGEKYYKEKAVVQSVIDKYRAKIKFLESGEKLKVDQAHLETVIPALNKNVLVVNGGYRGFEGVLRELDEGNYCVSVEIATGPLQGRIVKNLKYEDISKLHS